MHPITPASSPMVFRRVVGNQLGMSAIDPFRRARLRYAAELLIEATWLEEDGLATHARELRVRAQTIHAHASF